jgi:transposase-like protein
MKRSRYTDEQIAYALRQAESGTAVADVCRQLGISEAVLVHWRTSEAHHSGQPTEGRSQASARSHCCLSDQVCGWRPGPNANCRL